MHGPLNVKKKKLLNILQLYYAPRKNCGITLLILFKTGAFYACVFSL